MTSCWKKAAAVVVVIRHLASTTEIQTATVTCLIELCYS